MCFEICCGRQFGGVVHDVSHDQFDSGSGKYTLARTYSLLFIRGLLFIQVDHPECDDGTISMHSMGSRLAMVVTYTGNTAERRKVKQLGHAAESPSAQTKPRYLAAVFEHLTRPCKESSCIRLLPL
jgi:hypothetical protein